MSKWSKFASLARLLAPIVISSIDPKLAPLANTIGHGIAVAEELHSAKTGAEKLAYVQALAHDAALGINQAHGSEIVPVAGLDEATAHAIGVAVEVVNLAHSKVVTQ